MKVIAIKQSYELLANAIIELAAKDYRRTLHNRARHPSKRQFREEQRKIERFFRSRWFATLTELDPEQLIQRLRGDNTNIRTHKKEQRYKYGGVCR